MTRRVEFRAARRISSSITPAGDCFESERLMPRNKRRRVESDDEASKGSSLTSLPPVESNVDPSNDLAFIPIDSDSDSLAADDIFEVEAILGDTIKEGKMFYHIKWLGYDEVT